MTNIKFVAEYEISREKIERLLGRKINTPFSILGLDAASTTGWAHLKSRELTDKKVALKVGLIVVKADDALSKYNQFIEDFGVLYLTTQPKCVIIEDTYLRFRNPNVLKVLTRIGMIPFVLGHSQALPRRFVAASSARKTIGLNQSSQKADVVKYVNRMLGIRVKSDDIADAIVLALNGLVPNLPLSDIEKPNKLFGRTAKTVKKKDSYEITSH